MKKREQLLASAYKIFARYGYYGTYTRMIAKDAGASLSAIPYYFKTKEALFQEVTALAGDRVLAYMDGTLDEAEEALSRKDLSREEAKRHLLALLEKHVDYAFDPENAETIQIIREEHTFAEEEERPADGDSGSRDNALSGRLYDRVTDPMAALIERVTGVSRREAMVWSWNLIGEPLFFSYHRGFALYAFQEEEYSPENIRLIKEVILARVSAELDALARQ